MATPNIVNITTLKGFTSGFSLDSTNPVAILSNASASGKTLKINTIIVANVDGTNSADITIKYHTASGGGGTGYAISSTVSVPADSTLVIMDKASGIYLDENTSVVATASAADDLDVVISYEEIQ